MTREWTIQEVARATGTTSRTLRHYGDLGLLAPSRTGQNVLAARVDQTQALRTHLELLQEEADRLARLVVTVRTTLERTTRGEGLDVDEMFDGFDAGRYEEEVVQRWGRAAQQDATRNWREMGEGGRRAHQAEHDAIGAGLAAAAAANSPVDGPSVQDLVQRHHAWVSVFWTPDAASYRGLVQMYVDDERFRATYDAFGPGTAQFLQRAADVFAQRALS